MGAARYELKDRIGIGGMAEVWRAVRLGPDGTRGDTVVVKRILPHLSSDAEYQSMFVDEARIAATLVHPNVVRLLDLGRLDGQLFLAFELVDGADLDRLLRRAEASMRPMPLAIALFIAREVLRALDHAHRAKTPDGRALALVHRDVAPGNVLLSRGGAVKLADFGVAKAAVRGGRTVAGVIKGNTLYMSPEQIAGKPVDARTDLYAAGLLLLTMLAGRHPFAAEGLATIIDRVLRGDVPRVSTIAPVPPEVDELIARATAFDPDARYPDARAFLDALDELVAATGANASAQDLAGYVAALLPEDPIAEPTHSEPSIVARIEPLFDAAGNEATPAETTVLADERTPTLSARGVDPEDAGPVAWIDGLDEEDAEPTSPDRTPPTPEVEHRPSTAVIPGDAPVVAATVRPGFAHAPAQDGFAHPSGLLRGHRGAVSALALAGGPLAVSASHDGTVRVWEIASREERLCLRGHRGAVTSLALAPDGTAVSGGRDRTLRVWSLPGARETAVLEGHSNWVFAVALDGAARALSGGLDRTLRLWDLAANRCVRAIPAHEDAISAVAFVDGTTAVSGGYDRALRVWDLATGLETATLLGGRGVRAIAAAGARRIATGGADCLVSIWDLQRNHLVHRLDGHLEPVVTIAFAPDGRHVLSGSYDGTIRLWDAAVGASRGVFGTGGEPVMSLAVAPDGAFFLAGRADGTIELWPLHLRA